jgi:hypothetical protein
MGSKAPKWVYAILVGLLALIGVFLYMLYQVALSLNMT